MRVLFTQVWSHKFVLHKFFTAALHEMLEPRVECATHTVVVKTSFSGFDVTAAVVVEHEYG